MSTFSTQNEKKLSHQRKRKPVIFGSKDGTGVLDIPQNAVEMRKLLHNLEDLDKAKRKMMARLDSEKNLMALSQAKLIEKSIKSKTDLAKFVSRKLPIDQRKESAVDVNGRRSRIYADSSIEDIKPRIISVLRESDGVIVGKTNIYPNVDASAASLGSVDKESDNPLNHVETEIAEIENMLGKITNDKQLKMLSKKIEAANRSQTFLRAHSHEQGYFSGSKATALLQGNKLYDRVTYQPLPNSKSRKTDTQKSFSSHSRSCAKANCTACEFRLKQQTDDKIDIQKLFKKPVTRWQLSSHHKLSRSDSDSRTIASMSNYRVSSASPVSNYKLTSTSLLSAHKLTSTASRESACNLPFKVKSSASRSLTLKLRSTSAEPTFKPPSAEPRSGSAVPRSGSTELSGLRSEKCCRECVNSGSAQVITQSQMQSSNNCKQPSCFLCSAMQELDDTFSKYNPHLDHTDSCAGDKVISQHKLDQCPSVVVNNVYIADTTPEHVTNSSQEDIVQQEIFDKESLEKLNQFWPASKRSSILLKEAISTIAHTCQSNNIVAGIMKKKIKENVTLEMKESSSRVRDFLEKLPSTSNTVISEAWLSRKMAVYNRDHPQEVTSSLPLVTPSIQCTAFVRRPSTPVSMEDVQQCRYLRFPSQHNKIEA